MTEGVYTSVMNDTESTLTEMSKALIIQLNAFCVDHGLVGKVKADHICIKCSTTEIFEKRREGYEFNSTFVYQSIISNRRISIIGLKDPIQTSIGDIKYLELSDQKEDRSQIDRIDHIEIVPTTISYDELVTLIKQKSEVKETVRPHHTTHDIVLPSGFTIRLSKEMLIDKIKREEMK